MSDMNTKKKHEPKYTSIALMLDTRGMTALYEKMSNVSDRITLIMS
jgi:hypothetical protein